jgi:hypothetical protein
MRFDLQISLNYYRQIYGYVALNHEICQSFFGLNLNPSYISNLIYSEMSSINESSFVK